MSDKRPSLASDANQPKLRESKPPFGLTRKRWNQLRLRGFIVAAVFASLIAVWLITRRGERAAAHRIQGERFAPYYAVAREEVGCENPVSQEPDGTFIGIHQGFPPGPVLVECHFPQECATVTQRDPDLAQPATFRGALADVHWEDWATPPSILMDQDGRWAGVEQRSWSQDGECHVVERHEVLALEDERLVQSVEILHGSRECATGEDPELQCVYRRVRQLRALHE